MVLALPPSKADRLQALAQPIEDKPALDPKPIRIKHEFRNDEKHRTPAAQPRTFSAFHYSLVEIN